MAEEELMTKAYDKVLIAKYSPENKCFVDEGEVLTIVPKGNLPKKDHVKHLFVSITDLKTKSQYGWVKQVKEFTVDDFIGTHYGNQELTNEQKEHILILLNSISGLRDETPVAATYSQKGFMEKKMVLKVHKVLFHGA